MFYTANLTEWNINIFNSRTAYQLSTGWPADFFTDPWHVIGLYLIGCGKPWQRKAGRNEQRKVSESRGRGKGEVVKTSAFAPILIKQMSQLFTTIILSFNPICFPTFSPPGYSSCSGATRRDVAIHKVPGVVNTGRVKIRRKKADLVCTPCIMNEI